jgi:predicted nucleic acid-binding protein
MTAPRDGSLSRFLIDTSALARLLKDEAVRTGWEEQVTSGLVAVCSIVELEFLYSARSSSDRDSLVRLLDRAFAWVPMPDRVFARAFEVQGALTERGHHRSASAVDLLVAAAAELNSLTLLHYDRDFDQIAQVTRQPMTWVAPPGSVN